MSYGMGYYDGNEYDADEYEEQDQYEEQPQQRQRNAPRSPGLRQAMRQLNAENQQLKRELDETKAMVQELVDDEAATRNRLFQQQSGHPRSPRLTQEEMQQMQRMQEMGVLGVAAPMGTQREQAARIQNCKTPEELMAYLQSQGNPNYYNGN
ncbi:hypothetical protein [Streptomyces sp. NPDC048192]|uniref:hypothetical protein n=1 Tax=Streptomyces sp. NPDC048192 TaxID=3365510 RepID=UPI00371C5799